MDRHKNQVLLFDRKGKFIHKIGKKGQGPGEYASLTDIAVDEEENRIYLGGHKLICYDFEGNYMKQVSIPGSLAYMLYTHKKLMLITTQIGEKPEEDGLHHDHANLYTLEKNMQITDSIHILSISFEKYLWLGSAFPYFMSVVGDDIYLYYPVFIPEPIIRNILYQVKGQQLLPNIQLAFNEDPFDSNGSKRRVLWNVYRSSRFIFSQHRARSEGETSYFCHDLQTGQGYNTVGGFTDDFYTREQIHLRPFGSNTDQFYFLYTNLSDDNIDFEPNPTLYIGTLKK